MKMNITTEKLLSDEENKAAFLQEIEKTMQQLDKGEINREEGYKKLTKLMERKEIQQIFQTRVRSIWR